MKLLKLLLVILIIFSLLTIVACEKDEDSDDHDVADDEVDNDDDETEDTDNDDTTKDDDETDDDGTEDDETDDTTSEVTVSYIDLLNKVAELDTKLEDLGSDASSYEDTLDEIEDALDQASTSEDLGAIESDLEDLETNIDAAIAGLPVDTTPTNTTIIDEEEEEEPEEEEESEPIVINIDLSVYLEDWIDSLNGVDAALDDMGNVSDPVINNTIDGLNDTMRRINMIQDDLTYGLSAAAVLSDVEDVRLELMGYADDLDLFLDDLSTSHEFYDEIDSASDNIDDTASEMYQIKKNIEDAYAEATSDEDEEGDGEEYSEECFDSDGIDFYTAGYTTGIYYTGTDTPARYDDECRDDDDTYDYYCADSGKIKRKTFSCEFGCEEGVCLTS